MMKKNFSASTYLLHETKQVLARLLVLLDRGSQFLALNYRGPIADERKESHRPELKTLWQLLTEHSCPSCDRMA